MYQACTRVLDSTSITTSCAGKFIDEVTEGLVVVKHDVLELYSLPGIVDGNGVQLTSVYNVSQAIESVLAVRFPGYDIDCLVLAFAEAKLSVLKWNHSRHEFETISLHLLDDPVMILEKEPSDEVRGRIQLYLDPGSVVGGRSAECILALVHQRFLFVIPFAKSTSDPALEIMGGGGNDVACEYPLGQAMLVDLHSHNMRGIPDISFVDGYYTPTIMILHEDEQSWAGRLKMALGDDGQVVEKKSLTMCASVLSITLSGDGKIDVSNIPIATKLPYNVYKLVPLQTEPYGAMVIGINTVLHISKNEQSGYAVHVNNFGRDEFLSDPALQMPFAEGYLKHNDKRITLYSEPGKNTSTPVRFILCLANARIIPLDENNLFTVLASGEAIVIKVNRQGTVVSDISVGLCSGLANLTAHPVEGSEQLPSCPIPSCLSKIGDYIFVGSRMGDSVLLRKDDESFSKVLTFQNTGPITDLSLGDSSVEPPDEVQLPMKETFPTPSLGMSAVVPIHLKPSTKKEFQEKHTSMEVVATTGRGKDGAVCILQRSVKPLVLCKYDAPCEGVFSLKYNFGQKRKLGEEVVERTEVESKQHQCVFVSGISNTSVLRVLDEDLVESSAAPFLRDETTLFACNINTDLPAEDTRNAICQVTRTSAIICDDQESFYRFDFLDEGTASVHQAFGKGRCVICFMTDGTLRIISATYVSLADEPDQPVKLQVDVRTPEIPDVLSYGFITACSLSSVPCNDPFFCTNDVKPGQVPPSEELSDILTVVTIGGVLFLYRVSDWELLKSFPNLLDLPQILTPEGIKSEASPSNLHVVDIFLGRVDPLDSMPHLMMMTSDDQLYGYKGFYHHGLLFSKISHAFGERRAETANHPTAPPKLSCVDQSMELYVKKHGESNTISNIFAVTPQQPRIFQFRGVMGNDGLFIRSSQGGSWVFSEKTHIRVHPMVKMAGVKSFAALNTPSCKNGFAIATEEGIKLMLLTWHKRMNFKSPWPTRKILLRGSPKQIVFDPVLRTYTLVVAYESPFKPVKTAFDSETDIFLENINEKVPKEITSAEGIPTPMNGRYELQLYSALSWKPFTGVGKLKENEKVLACTSVTLKRPEGYGSGDRDRRRDRGSSSQMSTFQAVGTAFPISEDIPCRGRILLLRVRVGRARDDRVLEIEHEISTKGPVTAITSSGGYLFAAVAGKIYVYVYDWNKKTLDFVSWAESRMYTSNLTSIKNLILAGDLFQSVQMHRWTESGHQLTPLAKDVNSLSSSCCEFIVDRGVLTTVLFDDNGNISTYSYDPATSQQILQPLSDIFIGTSTTRAIRLRTFHIPSSHESDVLRQGLNFYYFIIILNRSKANLFLQLNKTGNRVALLFGTHEGALYTLQPIMEHTHRDLHVCYIYCLLDSLK